jgi:hypothetical protein
MHPEAEAFNQKALKGIEALTALVGAGPPDTSLPPPDQQRPLMVGWGSLAALTRQAHAVIALFNAGLGHEAAPNRRLMIEYMALIQWLARDGEHAVDAINKAHQYSQGKVRKAADGADIKYDAERANVLASLEIGGDKSFHAFNQTARLLQSLSGNLIGDWANPGMSKRLGAMWIGETQLSHATLTAVQCFIETEAESTLLLDEPRYPIEEHPPAVSPIVAFSLLTAGAEAFNELLVGSPWAEELDRIAIEYGLKHPDGSGNE